MTGFGSVQSASELGIQNEEIMLHLIWYVIGGAVTHLFSPPTGGGRFHPAGLIVSILGAVLVLYLWHKFRLQLPRG